MNILIQIIKKWLVFSEHGPIFKSSIRLYNGFAILIEQLPERSRYLEKLLNFIDKVTAHFKYSMVELILTLSSRARSRRIVAGKLFKEIH